MQRLRIDGKHFIDAYGREVHLRGVNLSGSTKTPPNEPTHIVNTFSKHREVSFVGRPFPEEEADQHYQRLKHWGFNCLRFLVTWEAVEHAGRGQYDQDYLDYLTRMVKLAGDYGFYVFIDPHQDVWSRMTGGDGAPGWTLESIGFDISTLDISEAAFTMQRRYPDYPMMVWSENNSRLATSTMFTLFLCGDMLAPGLEIDGMPVQEFLQGAFIDAMCQIAEQLKDMPHVIGYGPLNEPSKGYIGIESLSGINVRQPRSMYITAENTMFLGAGIPRECARVHFENLEWNVHSNDIVLLNPHGVSAWQSPEKDIWRSLGVWDIDESGNPVVLKDDCFANTDFLHDGLIPFNKRYIDAIREIDPYAVVFVESTPSEAREFNLEGADMGTVVNASHWYDEQMLFSRMFDGVTARDLGTGQLVHGREAVVEAFRENIEALTHVSDVLGGVPTLIGEFGVCYDMNGKASFRTGDFSMQELALNLYYDALDTNLAHSTQWNYTPDNNNRWGDNWNEEDLSIFSYDQQDNPDDINSGGRAIKGFCRPRIVYAAGKIQSMTFDWQHLVFQAYIIAEENIDQPTIVFVPNIWFGNDLSVEVSDGEWSHDGQHITWKLPTAGHHHIKVLAK